MGKRNDEKRKWKEKRGKKSGRSTKEKPRYNQGRENELESVGKAQTV